ncbi:Leucine-rich repeat, ribonuclease inhibitor subtype [Strigomonas culicis]|uniref:Leucine-rich repeat, ribonuclease inhibitor subtype n=1 Tax=Strigomonas culicis TaxID=28005 RepID=S9VEI6_9TRYP|nr:Leucine-rich repeat, ribonuclease inhibitor subtype [Strigomonas culicis]EPY25511.1 Leucine-rich repeat, ribonuclease inhibitor subtype [Strigomonas culicis]|eukprot:EPY20698.1 Leucine-rich repeat, ribonuclease inhibitor subtype [Strigomonas culicis]
MVECCNVYDDTANQFFALFSTNLRELHLCNTNIDAILTDIPLAVLEGSLTTLQLAGTPLRQETLQSIAPALKRIEYLSLENCSDVISFEPIGAMRTLRFLDISGAYSGDGIDSLRTCAQLELFRMADAQIDNLLFLNGSKHLRVLDAPASALTDYSIMFLAACPTLDTVVLSGSLCISDINVLHTCPNIRRIFCPKTGVTNEGVAQLVACEHLEELDLKLTSITDANLFALCKNLKTINVCGTVSTQDGVQALLDREDLDVICDSFDGDDYMDG